MTLKTPWVAAWVCVVMAASARVATAQTTIIGFGGVTEAAARHPFGGGALGAKAGPVELSVEIGKFSNIVPKRIAASASEWSGGLVKAELPAWYGLGSLRLIASSGVIAPYVSAGAGIARLTPSVTVNTAGKVLTVFGDDDPANKFLIGLGGGLRVTLGRAFIDGGYRYIRVFQHYQSDTNFNNDEVLVRVHDVHVGLGIRF